ncbi:LuxR family transcriptional regulator [uncultured Adlercreutzia sp.]|uniref:helix-turn-helix transcriptional regulator n=1 Tax=uncultured Adlercreutzia sp. TaxID=875803 RepID=UPI002675DF01|nr:LuxR family transcriptional regulator [uncultured Adlercreutzia sp.]
MEEKHDMASLCDGASARRGGLPVRMATCAGLGLLLGWIVSLLLRGGVMSGPFFGQRSLSFDPLFCSATLAAAFSFASFCFPLRFLEGHLGSRRALVGIALVTAAAAVCTGIVGLVPMTSVAACYGLGAVIGVGIAVLIMMWVLVLSCYDPRETVGIVLVDMLIALGCYLAVHFSSKVIGVPGVTAVISLAMLVGSFVLLAAQREMVSEAHSPVEPARPTLAKLAAFALVTSFIVEYVAGFMVQRGAVLLFPGTHTRFTHQIVAVLICAAIIGALAWALHRLDRRIGSVVTLLYRIIVLCLVASMGLALLSFEPLYLVADSMLLLARFLAFLGTWAIALHAVYLGGRDIVGPMGIVLASQFLGYFAGFAVAGRLFSLADGGAWSQVVVLVCLIAFAAITLFVLTDSDVDAMGRVAVSSASEGASLDERVAVARERFGLTEREADVLRLLASGRNAVSIQEALFISYNTVKVHKRNIYTKMDVHSQQEILSLMEDISR